MNPSDRALLDRYRSSGDDEAFGTLVKRYLDLVHAVARRVTGNDELARDVAQNTFIRLAQRSALIPPDVALTAWLHRVSRGLAVDLVRTESRRKQRELSSHFIPSAMENPNPEADWTALAPIVDELVDRLPAADRELLLRRFYRNQSHSEIAAQLGLTESVARKRAFRAVEKLRVLLGKRGIRTSSAALATLLPAHAAPAAPVLLSASVLNAVIGITPITASFLTTTLLAVTTSQKIAFAAACLLLIAATGYTFVPPSSAEASSAGNTISRSISIGENETSRSRSRRERAIPSSAAERLERLKTIMAIADPSERQLEIISYLDGLPKNLLEETTRLLVDLTTDDDLRPIQLAISGWAEVDPIAALDFTRSQPEGTAGADLTDLILRDWGAKNPNAAMEWVVEKSPEGSHERMNNMSRVLLGLVQTSVELVPQVIGALPNEILQDTALAALSTAYAGNTEMMWRLAEAATPAMRARILGSFAMAMDSSEAAVLLSENPQAVPFTNSESIYRRWACEDLDSAAAAISQLPPGELQRKATQGLLIGAIRTDIPKAVELMEIYPDTVDDRVRASLISALGETEPARALEQGPLISDEKQRDRVIAGELARWMAHDRAAAETWLSTHPQPPYVMDRLYSYDSGR